jgi:hypothetical protein
MTHQNHQTNGASLEDCHTNFFALVSNFHVFFDSQFLLYVGTFPFSPLHVSPPSEKSEFSLAMPLSPLALERVFRLRSPGRLKVF